MPSHVGLGVSFFIPNGSKDDLVARVLTLAFRLVPQEHEVRTKSGLWVVAAAQAPDMATFDGLKSIRYDLKEGTLGRLDAVVYSQACGCGRPRLACRRGLSFQLSSFLRRFPPRPAPHRSCGLWPRRRRKGRSCATTP
jgi:hypothetical protein